jgi:RHS repeat-associated protein
VSFTDNYPFGMVMKERSWEATSTDKYRFGFNGKEKDNEINVDGGSYDFGARIYDGRLGRWLSLDPLEKKYPMHSSYIYCAGNPILFIDFDGKDWFVNTKDGSVIYVKNASVITAELFKNFNYVDNPNDYERLGSNEMFGKKVGNEILSRNFVIDMGEYFMKDLGYKKAEKVKIEETVYKSGGRMGSEDFENVLPSLIQIGNSKITYVKPTELNQKEVISESESKSHFSSSQRILYNLTKPFGQSNRKTSEFPENRSAVTKAKSQLVAEIVLFIIEVISK